MNTSSQISTSIATLLFQAVKDFEVNDVTMKEKISYAYTVFESAKTPSISLSDYFFRLHQFMHCSDSSFVLCFIYLDTILQKNFQFRLNSNNIHR